MPSERALITGISGQDGAYLARFLLDKGYTVYGGLRSSSDSGLKRLEALGVSRNVQIVPLDLLDTQSVIQAVRTATPDEIYNLASQSFVGWSWRQSVMTAQVNAIGALSLLDIAREFAPESRFYQASSSEMFGNVEHSPQNENTPFQPRNPYGVSKTFAHQTCVNAREALSQFVCCGILFNHESPLRAEHFVTRKISLGLTRYKLGTGGAIELGNLDSERDWGFAGEYVQGMWQMLQQDRPDDYVLATGTAVSVRTFVELVARALDMDIEWSGTGLGEVGRDRATGTPVVTINPDFLRPPDTAVLRGDAGKAAEKLGWRPTVRVGELAEMMVRAEYEHPAGPARP